MSNLKAGITVRTNKAVYVGTEQSNGVFGGKYIPPRTRGLLIGQRQSEPTSVWVVSFDEPPNVLVLEADLEPATAPTAAEE